ncbi:hypothetical protein [Chitinophaga pinensis]|uniref:Uncharacterized protein n=1 Tax=Chitinophaga pinensis TaxID=79329 RepID=A0A5C6LSQ4_9BACT|nr:hypothetical protein [Chitinophaga pinensis]TWV99676.1 hypothetical protein FEF09_15805 [Chitinophaga pinensis]
MSYEHLSERKGTRPGRAVAGEQLRGGISMPAIKPLLKKSAANDAPVQRYVHLEDDQHKVADNGEMYVEGVGAGNKLFATQSLIAKATQELQDAGVAVKLVKGRGTKDVQKPRAKKGEINTLTEVSLKNAQGNRKFEHVESCIDEARKIMEAGKAEGFENEELYQEVLGYLLEKTGSGAIVRERKEEIAGNERAKETGINTLTVEVYDEFRDLYYNAVYKTELDLAPEWEYVRKMMNNKYPREPYHTVESFWNNLERVSHMTDERLPEDLIPENVQTFKTALQGQLNTRQLLATHNLRPGQEVEGVNEKANPKVGGAFLILSGGDNYEKQLTWNFHWGLLS